MARIVWSPEASRRLIDISAYMLLTAPQHADAVVDRIVHAVDRLADFPHMGRALPGADEPTAREVILDPYHVIYNTDGEVVEISTILHGAMDIPSRLQDLLDRDP